MGVPDERSDIPEQPELPLEDKSRKDGRTAFGRVVPLLMDSYGRNKGRQFEPDQVAALAEGLLEMANTIDQQIEEIGSLQRQLEEAKPSKKIWTPNV